MRDSRANPELALEGILMTMFDARTRLAEDVVREVSGALAGWAEEAVAAGIARDRILIDPGLGFGKRHEDNLDLVRGLGALAELGLLAGSGGSDR